MGVRTWLCSASRVQQPPGLVSGNPASPAANRRILALFRPPRNVAGIGPRLPLGRLLSRFNDLGSSENALPQAPPRCPKMGLGSFGRIASHAHFHLHGRSAPDQVGSFRHFQVPWRTPMPNWLRFAESGGTASLANTELGSSENTFSPTPQGRPKMGLGSFRQIASHAHFHPHGRSPADQVGSFRMFASRTLCAILNNPSEVEANPNRPARPLAPGPWPPAPVKSS